MEGSQTWHEIRSTSVVRLVASRNKHHFLGLTRLVRSGPALRYHEVGIGSQTQWETSRAKRLLSSWCLQVPGAMRTAERKCSQEPQEVASKNLFSGFHVQYSSIDKWKLALRERERSTGKESNPRAKDPISPMSRCLTAPVILNGLTNFSCEKIQALS